MNKIVRDHYRISALPADLRASLPADGEVRITLEVAEPAPVMDGRPPRPEGQLSRFRHLGKARFSSMDEINAHVRALRDEWDHRSR